MTAPTSPSVREIAEGLSRDGEVARMAILHCAEILLAGSRRVEMAREARAALLGFANTLVESQFKIAQMVEATCRDAQIAAHLETHHGS